MTFYTEYEIIKGAYYHKNVSLVPYSLRGNTSRRVRISGTVLTDQPCGATTGKKRDAKARCVSSHTRRSDSKLELPQT